MVERQFLHQYLEEYLAASQFEDVCPNGLQVEGESEIHRLVTGVSACEELFRRAAELEAQAVLVHHGIFWRGDPYPLVGVQFQRVAALLRHRLNLFAYHLPLDGHPEVGNNALAARQLDLQELQPFGTFAGQSIGVRGRLPAPIPLQQLLPQLTSMFEREPLVFPYGPGDIVTVGIVSGGGGSSLREAIASGLDLFVTGEAEEWTMNLAREAGLHVVAGGHYASERLGVRALGRHLQQRFDVDVDFIDIPNPV